MRFCIRVITLLCLIAVRAPAQSVLTADSMTRILGEVARVSRQNDSLTRIWNGLQDKATELIADFKDHNASPCEFPSGQPELCADYDRVRLMLNARSADLQKALKSNDSIRSSV